MSDDPINIGGVLPSLHVKADLVPRRSEAGIGALMPWADRLWMITYPSNRNSGSGTGLYEIDESLTMRKRPESVVGTYANRLVHSASDQMIIGPHIIDAEGGLRTIEPLVEHRLTATMDHLEEPERLVYFLTMEALFFETDVKTLETKLLFDLKKELAMPEGASPHFKGGHTSEGRVVVTNNTYDEPEFLGERAGGRLAEWDGATWTTLEEKPFMEAAGRRNLGKAIFATGWDEASAILKVCVGGEWSTYRMPKSSHAYDHAHLTEWTRIREVETERFLMDCHGMFYELPAQVYGGQVWGVRPICTHLRIIPDFCSWMGLLVLAGNQNTPNGDSNPVGGQPQANLWLGKTDDLWQLGKPTGWGGPWRNEEVAAGEPSDPYLMTGFEHKVLHLAHDAEGPVNFTVQVDFLGEGSWQSYETIQVPAGGYVPHVFPTGFSAHWARVVADRECRATAWFVYT
jgi:hypothetical protein